MDSKGGIIIEEEVWLGAGVTVLDGAVIKRGAVIGAMSLVNGVVEEYSINAGVPCKKIGERK
jgi:acetyltransferase-like isoleucine patch superfamily enzyme